MRISRMSLVLILALYGSVATAQWVQTSGPSGGLFVCFTAAGKDLYTGSAYGGIFRSSDNGSTWVSVGTGLPGRDVRSLVVGTTKTSDTIFAGTSGSGVFRSTDEGLTWIETSDGLTNTSVYALAMAGNRLVAGTYDGIFVTDNGGNRWSKAIAGGNRPFFVSALLSWDPDLFAATMFDGVYKSTDGGLHWNQANTGLTEMQAYDLATTGSKLFVSTAHGVFSSTDRGADWTNVSDLPNWSRHALAATNSHVVVAAQGGPVWLSADNGASWRTVNSGMTNLSITVGAASGTAFFLGTEASGVFRLMDGDTIWTPVNTGLVGSNIISFGTGPERTSATNLYVGMQHGGMFVSSDFGASWNSVNAGLTSLYDDAYSFARNGSTIFSGNYSGVYRSTDDGRQWTKVRSLGGNHVLAYDDVVYAATDYGLVRSVDDGASWSLVGKNLGYHITSLAACGDMLLAGTAYDGLFVSTDGGFNWTPFPGGIPGVAHCFAVLDTNLFVATDQGVYRLINRSSRWAFAGPGMEIIQVSSLAAVDKYLFAGTYSQGVFLSTDQGGSWNPVNTGLYGRVNNLGIAGGYLFAGTLGVGVWRRPLAEMITVKKPNLLGNAGFEWGRAPWHFYGDNNSGTFSNAAPGERSPHSAKVDISSPGKNVQLYQSGITLKAHTRYRLNFDACSNTGHRLSVFLHKHGVPYTCYGVDNLSCELGRSWKRFMVEFTTTCIEDYVTDARLRFWFAPYAIAGDQYFIDDVELVEIEPQLITNGDFEWGTNGWEFYTDGAGSFDTGAETDANNHVGHIKIDAPGSNVQLYQSGVALEAGGTYRLSCRACSITGRPLSVYLHKHGSPYSSYGLEWSTVPVTTAWQTFSREFTASGFTGTAKDGRLRFWLAPYAQEGDEYFFDDVTLTRIDGGGGSSVITNAASKETDMPKEFALAQNYPNPFNPLTIIKYTIAGTGDLGLGARNTSLVVYDVLGREVAVLVNERKLPGQYEVPFDGTRLSSGVYFCRMEAGSFVQSLKMLLLK